MGAPSSHGSQNKKDIQISCFDNYTTSATTTPKNGLIIKRKQNCQQGTYVSTMIACWQSKKSILQMKIEFPTASQAQIDVSGLSNEFMPGLRQFRKVTGQDPSRD